MKSSSKLVRSLVALALSLLLVASMMPIAVAAPAAVSAITKAGNAPLYDALHAAPYKLDPANTGAITSTELASLTGTINFTNKGIGSLDGLQYAVNAMVLVLSGDRGVSDITPVIGMRKLQELYMPGTSVQDFPTDMSNLTNLVHLSCAASPIRETAENKAAILSLPHVRKYDPKKEFTLLLEYTYISDISFLAKAAAPGVTDLYWGNTVGGSPAKYETLAPLTQLKFLDMSYDSGVGAPGSKALATIGAHLKNLIDLRLSNCGITSLNGLSGMPNLVMLTINDNYVSDLTPLKGIRGNFRILHVTHNYLDPTPGSADRAILDKILAPHYENQVKIPVHFDAAPYANPADVSTYYGANITLPDVTGIPEDKMLIGWDTEGDGAADHAAGSEVAFTSPELPVPAGRAIYKACYRDVDPNGLLTGIALSPASLKLSPVFTGTRLEYTVSLPASTGSVTITPGKPEIATMTIDGEAVAAKTVSLGCGQSKTVTIAVTSDKGNQLTYRVTVTRAKPDAAHLLSLGNTAGSLSPAFDPYKTSYTLTLPKSVGSVTLKPAKAAASSRLYINGKLASSKTFKLAPGKSVKVTVKVKSASGAACAYTITIKR